MSLDGCAPCSCADLNSGEDMTNNVVSSGGSAFANFNFQNNKNLVLKSTLSTGGSIKKN